MITKRGRHVVDTDLLMKLERDPADRLIDLTVDNIR